LLQTVLADLTQLTMTFDLVTPKMLGFLCYPRWMCGPSLRKVGKDVPELLIRNEKITDRHVQRVIES